MISLVAFGLLYTALAVIDAVLMIRYARRELAPVPATATEPGGQPRVPSMLY